ncbi:hypothetical protein VTI74DRAFT_7563 [Chaetomium olivicolor]
MHLFVYVVLSKLLEVLRLKARCGRMAGMLVCEKKVPRGGKPCPAFREASTIALHENNGAIMGKRDGKHLTMDTGVGMGK